MPACRATSICPWRTSRATSSSASTKPSLRTSGAQGLASIRDQRRCAESQGRRSGPCRVPPLVSGPCRETAVAVPFLMERGAGRSSDFGLHPHGPLPRPAAQWRCARSSPIPLRVSPGLSPGSLASFSAGHRLDVDGTTPRWEEACGTRAHASGGGGQASAQLLRQEACCTLRIGGIADGAHRRDAGCAGCDHRHHGVRVDAADGDAGHARKALRLDVTCWMRSSIAPTLRSSASPISEPSVSAQAF